MTRSRSRGSAQRHEREQLEAERDHLLASIVDLDLERAAGGVDEVDYRTLRAGYVARAAQAIRALDALGEEALASSTTGRTGDGDGAGVGVGVGAAGVRSGSPGASSRLLARRARTLLGRRRTTRLLFGAALLSLVGAVAATAVSLAAPRLPGQYATGSVTLSKAAEVRQQLTQAAILGSEGKVREAVDLYGEILREAPDNAQALAYQGWLVRLTGLAGHARPTVRAADDEIARAVAVDPRYADARAFDAIALLEDRGELSAALAQLRAFLADHPSTALLDGLGPSMAQTFKQAHVAVPLPLQRFEHMASVLKAPAKPSKHP